MENNITLIGIDKLVPHPDNPRGELGDLTELAESIKTSGIMQNLVVVPNTEDTYTVIIGHRRTAAARIAGLTELPCVITEMTPTEQVSTMLLENMQRNDLTVYEQAQGMQMLLDLGETQTSIAARTGLSNATVSRRLKIASLDKKRFKEAELRGGTLDDYLKVSEIKDDKTRDKLTELIGTSNFNWEYGQAIKKQNLKDKMPLIKKEMKAIGAVKDDNAHTWSGDWVKVTDVSITDFAEGCLTDKAKKQGEYVWNISYDTTVNLLKKKPKEKKEKPKKSEKEIAANKRRADLKAVTNSAAEIRREFVLSFNSCKKYADVLNEWLWEYLRGRLTGKYSSTNWEILCEKIGEPYEKYKYSCSRENLDKFFNEHPGNAPIVVLLAVSEYGALKYYTEEYNETMPKYHKCEALDTVYKYLCRLGYEMSDEEIALQNGTHELFEQEEE